MLSLFPYIVKAVIISGILFGYYWLALRDRKFHRFNRFYLLSALALPLILPFVHLNFFFAVNSDTLPAVLQGDIWMDAITITVPTERSWNVAALLNGTYLLVAFTLCMLIVHSIVQIFLFSKRGQSIRTSGILLVKTPVKGTPFSFFKRVFWNPATSLHSAEGIKLLNHELAHCRQWHSADKIFAGIACALFWFNPFFWFIKKELYLVHEFLADEKSFQSDTAAFSRIVLQGVFPDYTWGLTNNFFFSPIKRRIMMLFKNKQRKVNYMGRIFILPLVAGLFLFFTMKDKASSGMAANFPVIVDTIPQSEIKSIDVKTMVVVTTKDGKKETMTIEEAIDAGIITLPIEMSGDEVIWVQGHPVNGPVASKSNITGKIFTKVEQEASFPGGPDAWRRYITKVMKEHYKEFGKKDYGTCVVKFIVDKQGNVSGVMATNMRGTQLASVAVNAIRKGPKWIPAKQNGHYVNSYHLQPIILAEPD